MKISGPGTLMLKPPQVALQLGVDVGKVLYWIHVGDLVAINVAARRGGRPRWRIALESLDEFLRRRQSPAPVMPRPSRSRRKTEKVTEFF